VADDDFVEQMLRSPGGASVLHALEMDHRTDLPWFDFPIDSSPDAVALAAASVETMTVDELVRRIVSDPDRVCGPWIGDAPENYERVLRLASRRRPIANAIAAKFATQLRTDIDHDAQQWWTAGQPQALPLFKHRDDAIYCCGEFTFQGIWTVSAPPTEVHDELVSVWELYPGPITRWRLPVSPDCRLFELHEPADWVRLVTQFPRRSAGTHGSWGLPQRQGPPSWPRSLVGSRRRERHAIDEPHIMMPDWTKVAETYDGVHLSWAGALTAEATVSRLPELGPNAVTMLRYWHSDRTLWLNDVFGVPEPLAAPVLGDRIDSSVTEASAPAARRATLDMGTLAIFFDRDPFAR
jgi:hypothetical protein